MKSRAIEAEVLAVLQSNEERELLEADRDAGLMHVAELLRLVSRNQYMTQEQQDVLGRAEAWLKGRGR